MTVLTFLAWLMAWSFASGAMSSAAGCGSSCYDDRVCFDPTGGKGSPAGVIPGCPGRDEAVPSVEKRLFQSVRLCSVDSNATLVVHEALPTLCCYGPGVDDCYELKVATSECASAADASVILKKDLQPGTTAVRHENPQTFGCCYQVSVRDNGLRRAHAVACRAGWLGPKRHHGCSSPASPDLRLLLPGIREGQWLTGASCGRSWSSYWRSSRAAPGARAPRRTMPPAAGARPGWRGSADEAAEAAEAAPALGTRQGPRGWVAW